VASGKESPIQMTYERSAMEACLAKLERHGYLIPDLSWFKIRAVQQNEYDIVSLCERLAQGNQNDMVCEFLSNLIILWYFLSLCEAVHNICLPSPL
jgi:hypothetical protein